MKNGAIVVKNIIDKNILKTIVRKFQNIYSNQTKIQDSYDNLINYLDKNNKSLLYKIHVETCHREFFDAIEKQLVIFSNNS